MAGWHSDTVPPSGDSRGADRSALGERIGGRCRLQGEFLLRSGQVSATYFDKYLFEADPVLLSEVATRAAALIPAGTEVLAGLELGGIPVATALSLVTGLPTAFVRKQAKAYGTARLAEGAEVDRRRVLVVEDVITTGGQVARSTRDLRDRDAVVDSVLCVIDRSGGAHPALDGLACSVISVFTADELG
jgi:orotate phosphoribosyltransferase